MVDVMFVASTGGHLAEILKIQKLFDKYKYVLVTEKNSISLKLKNKYNIEFLMLGSKINIIRYIPVCFINIIKSIFLYFKYRPRVIYTTGAHTCVPLCFIGHLFKTKIIFMEVYDRIDNPSLTAKIIYKISDTFIVQHKEMLKVFPKAKYIGGVY